MGHSLKHMLDTVHLMEMHRKNFDKRIVIQCNYSTRRNYKTQTNKDSARRQGRRTVLTAQIGDGALSEKYYSMYTTTHFQAGRKLQHVSTWGKYFARVKITG